MTNDSAALLDDLLCRWHQWQQADRPSRGYAPKALVVGDYRTSRQYDDCNGALDDELEQRTMRTVDFQVRQMPEPHRSAIYALARALAVGAEVFMSPRLPQDKAERQRIVAEARLMLTKRLLSAGAM